ncbi:hypothetical protein [Bradyrhizobium sp. HKCCYLS20291]|uniref:hypothetical protein n=1 Tax=Bradyrhizobium sp. HKCCYLS20291 TaxID=3420766 RepID=UPI003EBC58BF
MFQDLGALISLPAADLAKVRLPGSIFPARELLALDLREDLKAAVRLIMDICDDHGVDSLVVARPEMFTNGPTLAWLRHQIGGIEDHICISDGRTVRVVPGMTNHAFFMRLGVEKNFERFVKLQKRCPELIRGLASQLNSAFTFPTGASIPTVILQPAEGLMNLDPAFLPFCLVRHSVEATFEQIALSGKIDLSENFSRCSRLVYVPLSEIALQSEGFCRYVAREIAAAFFDPTAGMILALPAAETAEADIKAGIERLVESLRGIPGGIPPVASHRIVLASQQCPESFLFRGERRVELVLHHSLDAWLHPPEYYARFDHIVVAASRAPDTRDLYIEYVDHLLGRRPEFYWLEHLALHPNDTGLVAAW